MAHYTGFKIRSSLQHLCITQHVRSNFEQSLVSPELDNMSCSEKCISYMIISHFIEF